LRTPLQLDDNYKKVEGKLRHTLLQELQSLAQQPQPVKRKRQDEDGGGKRRGRGGEDAGNAAGDESEGDGGAEEEQDNGLVKSKKPRSKADRDKEVAKAKKAAKGPAKDMSKASLSGWKLKPDNQGDEDMEEGRNAKRPMLVLKYLDGHTCAVRRRVKMSDLLGPWTLF